MLWASEVWSDPNSNGPHGTIINNRIANNGAAIKRVVKRMVVIEIGQFTVKWGFRTMVITDSGRS
ncbi:MAG TPA: hypothetical protein VOA41_03480 [Candidatus Dormibacteraeota bacterium]|nr:hypothetical protein [Candidatus Dormibacteraeota bacterium]